MFLNSLFNKFLHNFVFHRKKEYRKPGKKVSLMLLCVSYGQKCPFSSDPLKGNLTKVRNSSAVIISPYACYRVGHVYLHDNICLQIKSDKQWSDSALSEGRAIRRTQK